MADHGGQIEYAGPEPIPRPEAGIFAHKVEQNLYHHGKITQQDLNIRKQLDMEVIIQRENGVATGVIEIIITLSPVQRNNNDNDSA